MSLFDFMLNISEKTENILEKLNRYFEAKDSNNLVGFFYLNNGIAEDLSEINKLIKEYKLSQNEQRKLLEACLIIKENEENLRVHKKDYKKNICEYFESYFGGNEEFKSIKMNLFADFYNAFSIMKINDNAIKDDKKVDINIINLMNYLANLYNKDDEELDRFKEFFSENNKKFLNEIITSLEMKYDKKIQLTKKDLSKFYKFKNKIPSLNLGGIDVVRLYEVPDKSNAADEKPNDFCLENIKIYYNFISEISKINYRNNINIIIDPSSIFIKKIVKDSYLGGIKFLFVITNPKYLSIYKTVRIDNYQFISFSELQKIIEENNTKNYNILSFSNHNNISDKISNLLDLITNKYIKIDRLCLFGSDFDINNFLKIIINNENSSFQQIQLFPRRIYNSTKPERKIYLSSSLNLNVKEYDNCQLIRYKGSNNEEYLKELERAPFTFFTNKSELKNCDNIRNFFAKEEDKSEKKSDRESSKLEEFTFSEEIIFKYKVFSNTTKGTRIRAYIVNPLKDKTPILDTIKEKRTVQNVEYWLNNIYPYEDIKKENGKKTSIRKKFIDLYGNYFKSNEISLKTYLYLHPELDCLYDEYKEEISDLLNTKIGSTQLNEIDETILNESCESLLVKYNFIEKISTVVLSEIYDVLVKNKIVWLNPFKKSAILISENDKAYLQVRNALVKRHFTIEQINSIYNKCTKNIDNEKSYKLAILIKLFTGIETSSLCALKWKDFIEISLPNDEPFYLLFIRRKVSFNGKEFLKLERKEKYRYIPLPRILSNLLLKEREFQKDKYNYEDIKFLSDKSIIYDQTNFNYDENNILSPSKLNNYIKRILEKVISKNEISLPNNDEEERILDLNDYRGDNFKANYKHYALEYCGFDLSEISYLQGRKQEATFARNYCDYANMFSQIILQQKQERFANLCLAKNDEYSFSEENRSGEYISDKDSKNATTLQFYADEQCINEIKIDTKFGVKISIAEKRTRKDD